MELSSYLKQPAFITSDNQTAINKLLQLMVMQDRNNKIQHKEEWAACRSVERPDHRAAFLELCEGFEHIGWGQWWKKAPEVTEHAFKSYQVELIDVLHFTFSMLIRDPSVTDYNAFFETVFTQLNEASESLAESFEKNPVAILHSAMDMLVANLALQPIGIIERTDEESLLEVFNGLFYIMNLSNMTIDDVFKMYVGKNILNGLRGQNGYKKGHYIKNWKAEIDKVYDTNDTGFFNQHAMSSDMGGEKMPIGDYEEDNSCLEALLELDMEIPELETKMAQAYKQTMALYVFNAYDGTSSEDSDGNTLFKADFPQDSDSSTTFTVVIDEDSKTIIDVISEYNS